jgi:hypothetical protein
MWVVSCPSILSPFLFGVFIFFIKFGITISDLFANEKVRFCEISCLGL